MALFTITTEEKINLPPSQVGNGSAITNYSVIYVFTIADFTTLTSPIYSDPEGDTAANLKVLTLPSQGTLKLNNVNVTANQIIPFSSIGSGLFTYTPNNAVTTQYDTTFTFEIADSGSGQFVG